MASMASDLYVSDDVLNETRLSINRPLTPSVGLSAGLGARKQTQNRSRRKNGVGGGGGGDRDWHGNGNGNGATQRRSRDFHTWGPQNQHGPMSSSLRRTTGGGPGGGRMYSGIDVNRRRPTASGGKPRFGVSTPGGSTIKAQGSAGGSGVGVSHVIRQLRGSASVPGDLRL
jgi:hypothetical protein